MRGTRRFCLFASAAALTGVVAVDVTAAYAQTGIEEIVVTARKRAESLQEVPAAVTALSSETLRKAQVFDVSEIAQRTPSFTYQELVVQEQELFIRGIGTVRLDAATADSSVGLFLNEVYIGRRGTATPPVFDMERVEVLRGPQGTLYGRNVVGGAINFITARPQRETAGGGSIGYGNYNAINADAFITGPLGDKAAGRIAVQTRHRDGFGKNIRINQELENLESYAGRATLQIDASDRVEILLVADFSKDDSNGTVRHAVDDPTAPGIGRITAVISPDVRHSESPYPQYAERETAGLTAKVDWETSIGDVTYVAAWRYGDVGNLFTQAGAGSPPSLTDSQVEEIEDYNGYTQEIRLSSSLGDKARLITGLYYLYEGVDRTDSNTANSFLPGGPRSTRDVLDGKYTFFQEGVTENYAVFGELEYDLMPNLTLSVGARYTIDQKEFDNNAVAISFGPPGSVLAPAPLTEPHRISVSEEWAELTPRFALEWKASDDALIYGSITKGFKGGGWQGKAANAAAAATTYQPEFAWNYEVGAKTDWADGRVRLNLAAFYTDFTDLQVEQLDQVLLTLVISNAANAEIRGLEAEATVQLADGLQLWGVLSLLDTEYVNYVVPATGVSNDGNKLQRTPDYQFNVGIDYTVPVSAGYALDLRVDYSYQDKIFWNPENTYDEPAIGLLDARIGFGPTDGSWEVAVWGKNLTDEIYRQSTLPFLGDILSKFGPPATYGVQLSARF